MQNRKLESYTRYLGCECGGQGEAVFVGFEADRKLLEVAGDFERSRIDASTLYCQKCGRPAG